MTKTLKKGFTLVELIVVIAIIAILATVSVVGYSAFITNANQSKVDQELAQAENVLRAEAVATVTVSLDDVDVNVDDSTYHPTLVMSLEGIKIKFTFTYATPGNVQDLVDELIKEVKLSTLKGEFTLIENELKYTLDDVFATLNVVATIPVAAIP